MQKHERHKKHCIRFRLIDGIAVGDDNGKLLLAEFCQNL